MVTELLSVHCGADLAESYCNVSNISDTNLLRYLFSSYLNKICLSVWHHHLANLHILKTWISPERKEMFENSKQHFSSHAVYLFMFQNGLDRKDAIFIIVPLKYFHFSVAVLWHHHWSNLHNRKTSLSLERKKIFQKENAILLYFKRPFKQTEKIVCVIYALR